MQSLRQYQYMYCYNVHFGLFGDWIIRFVPILLVYSLTHTNLYVMSNKEQSDGDVIENKEVLLLVYEGAIISFTS